MSTQRSAIDEALARVAAYSVGLDEAGQALTQAGAAQSVITTLNTLRTQVQKVTNQLGLAAQAKQAYDQERQDLAGTNSTLKEVVKKYEEDNRKNAAELLDLRKFKQTIDDNLPNGLDGIQNSISHFTATDEHQSIKALIQNQLSTSFWEHEQMKTLTSNVQSMNDNITTDSIKNVVVTALTENLAQDEFLTSVTNKIVTTDVWQGLIELITVRPTTESLLDNFSKLDAFKNLASLQTLDEGALDRLEESIGGSISGLRDQLPDFTELQADLDNLTDAIGTISSLSETRQNTQPEAISRIVKQTMEDKKLTPEAITDALTKLQLYVDFQDYCKKMPSSVDLQTMVSNVDQLLQLARGDLPKKLRSMFTVLEKHSSSLKEVSTTHDVEEILRQLKLLTTAEMLSEESLNKTNTAIQSIAAIHEFTEKTEQSLGKFMQAASIERTVEGIQRTLAVQSLDVSQETAALPAEAQDFNLPAQIAAKAEELRSKLDASEKMLSSLMSGTLNDDFFARMKRFLTSPGIEKPLPTEMAHLIIRDFNNDEDEEAKMTIWGQKRELEVFASYLGSGAYFYANNCNQYETGLQALETAIHDCVRDTDDGAELCTRENMHKFITGDKWAQEVRAYMSEALEGSDEDDLEQQVERISSERVMDIHGICTLVRLIANQFKKTISVGICQPDGHHGGYQIHILPPFGTEGTESTIWLFNDNTAASPNLFVPEVFQQNGEWAGFSCTAFHTRGPTPSDFSINPRKRTRIGMANSRLSYQSQPPKFSQQSSGLSEMLEAEDANVRSQLSIQRTGTPGSLEIETRPQQEQYMPRAPRPLSSLQQKTPLPTQSNNQPSVPGIGITPPPALPEAPAKPSLRKQPSTLLNQTSASLAKKKSNESIRSVRISRRGSNESLATKSSAPGALSKIFGWKQRESSDIGSDNGDTSTRKSSNSRLASKVQTGFGKGARQAVTETPQEDRPEVPPKDIRQPHIPPRTPVAGGAASPPVNYAPHLGQGDVIHVGQPTLETKNLANADRLDERVQIALTKQDGTSPDQLGAFRKRSLNKNKQGLTECIDTTAIGKGKALHKDANGRCNECESKNRQCVIMIDEETALLKGEKQEA